LHTQQTIQFANTQKEDGNRTNATTAGFTELNTWTAHFYMWDRLKGSFRHDTKTTFALWWVVIGITQIMHLIYWTQALHHRQYIWNRPSYYERITYKCNGKSYIYRAAKNKVRVNESYTCITVLIHDEHWQQCHHSTKQTVATVPTYNHVTQHPSALQFGIGNTQHSAYAVCINYL
jgi:hypothetical protein